MKVVEKVKEVSEWIDKNMDEAMQIVADLNNDDVTKLKKDYQKSEHKTLWNDNLDAWVTTAKINGYIVTKEQFIQCCPIRDTINGWYSS